MSRTHSSRISLSCERSSNRIVSGPPLTRFPASHPPPQGLPLAVTYGPFVGLRFRRGPRPVDPRKTRERPPRSLGPGVGGPPACTDFKYIGDVKRVGDLALRIMIVGERILPFRHAGDKNFWLDMIRRLLQAGHEVEALSVDIEATPGDGLPIRHVPQIPIYFRP